MASSSCSTTIRFVQHVHHAGEAGADLAGEADALGFAARQGVGGAVERQVVEADVDQELQPAGDLADDLVGHLGTLADQRQAVEEGLALGQRQVADLGDVALADQHEARLGAQPAAVAHRAGAGSAVFGELFAHGDRIGFLVAAFEVGNDALEGVLLEHRLAAVGEVAKGDLVAPRAVQDHVADGGRQLLERRFHVEVVVVGEAGEKLEVELVAAVPAAHGAGGQRQIRVHDDPLGIEKVHLAKAVAAGAGAHRVVEREQARLEFGQRKAADRAGELGREQVLGAGIHLHGDGAAFGVGEGGFEGFRKAPAQILAHLDAIDHHLDAVTAVLVEHRQVVEFMDDAIHAYPHEALGAQFDEQVGLLALAPADHRGDDHQLGFFG